MLLTERLTRPEAVVVENFGHSADGIVPQGVLAEVGYQTLNQPGVTDDWSCCESGFDADPASVRFLMASSEYLFGDSAQVEGVPALDVVGTGESESSVKVRSRNLHVVIARSGRRILPGGGFVAAATPVVTCNDVSRTGTRRRAI